MDHAANMMLHENIFQLTSQQLQDGQLLSQ